MTTSATPFSLPSIDALLAASEACATAWLGQAEPVVWFDPVGLRQVGASQASHLWVPDDLCVAVRGPFEHPCAEARASVAVRRTHRAIKRWEIYSGRTAVFTDAKFEQAVEVVIDSGVRARQWAPFLVFNACDLREIHDLQVHDDAPAAGGVLWVELAGLPHVWPATVADAGARIIGCLADLVTEPVQLRPAA